MAACSSFGWSDEKQCVLVDSKEVLDQYIKQHPLRFYSSGKPFPLYPRLEAIFGKDRANGMFSMSGWDAEEHVQEESDVPIMSVDDSEIRKLDVGDSDSPMASSNENKRQRLNSTKRSKGDEVLLVLADSMKTMVGQQGKQIQVLANALCGVNDEVNMGRILHGLGFTDEELFTLPSSLFNNLH